MLNKTTCHRYLSDDEIYNSEDVCNENDLLSKYLTRQQTDYLKKTDWFRRRKKWNIPFQYRDLTMIRQTIQAYPDNWDTCLSDTIILSGSRYWVDWLLNETYEYRIKDAHRELWDREEEYRRSRIINSQLSALYTLYSAYYPQPEQTELSDIKHCLTESAQDLSGYSRIFMLSAGEFRSHCVILLICSVMLFIIINPYRTTVSRTISALLCS